MLTSRAVSRWPKFEGSDAPKKREPASRRALSHQSLSCRVLLMSVESAVGANHDVIAGRQSAERFAAGGVATPWYRHASDIGTSDLRLIGRHAVRVSVMVRSGLRR